MSDISLDDKETFGPPKPDVYDEIAERVLADHQSAIFVLDDLREMLTPFESDFYDTEILVTEVVTRLQRRMIAVIPDIESISFLVEIGLDDEVLQARMAYFEYNSRIYEFFPESGIRITTDYDSIGEIRERQGIFVHMQEVLGVSAAGAFFGKSVST